MESQTCTNIHFMVASCQFQNMLRVRKGSGSSWNGKQIMNFNTVMFEQRYSRITNNETIKYHYSC